MTTCEQAPDRRRAPYTVDEASEVSGIPRSTIYDGIARGEIPAIKIGRRRRIPAAYWDRLIDEGNAK